MSEVGGKEEREWREESKEREVGLKGIYGAPLPLPLALSLSYLMEEIIIREESKWTMLLGGGWKEKELGRKTIH